MEYYLSFSERFSGSIFPRSNELIDVCRIVLDIWAYDWDQLATDGLVDTWATVESCVAAFAEKKLFLLLVGGVGGLLG